MAITFTEAPIVAEGDKPTSQDMNKLAAAFNDRLRSGLGDAAWRIWFKAYSMFRALFPLDDGTPEDEWFQHWMHVPAADGAPVAPGDYHPFTRWAAGDGGLATEDARINAVPASSDDAPTAAWEGGKAQRGYEDPATGLHAAPAFEASIAHYNIYSWAGTTADGPEQNKTSYKFFKTFGGFASTPDSENCESHLGGVSTVRRFTNLRDSTVLTYQTCTAGADFVATIDYGPTQYILQVNPTVVTDPEDPEIHHTVYDTVFLSYRDWIEGPYGGESTLQKINSWQWNEIMCRYLQGFRGATSQRTGESWSIKGISFDFEKFFACQYRLAPAYAVDVGGGSLDARYPKAQFEGPVSEGTSADFVEGFAALIEGGNSYHFDTVAKFGMAGYRIHAEGLTEPVRILLTDLNAAEADIPLTVENGDVAVWLDVARRPWLGVAVAPGQTIPDGAVVWIEFAHLQVYRPDLTDAYVVMRRGTTSGAGACDTEGENYTAAKSFGESYIKRGHILCETDVLELDETNINGTPIYEAARKMLRERLRLLTLDSFVDLDLVDGKSVLKFDRFLSFGGHSYDLFEGIAPPNAAIASGSVLEGVLYKVRGTGTVTYDGADYVAGETLTGSDGVASYTVAGGDAAPWQVDGIVATAPKRGVSNRWQMFITLCPYGGAGYEDETYGDVLGFLMNRCMINSHAFALDDPLMEHMCANSSGSLCVKPEAPSAFNYTRGLNAAADEDFYSSCPVYPKDYEVESVLMDYDTDQVTVTLAGRLRHNADSSIRTDENGLEDFLALGGGECALKTGDVAVDADDSPTHGACKPRFYFTKLAEEVYEDANTTLEATDTRLIGERMLWLNWMLEAMCEGYIDNAAPAELCHRQPCYLFRNLCHQALGSQWFPLTPLRLLNDNSQGFGSMPNMKLYREHFNNLASCVNMLRTVPLDLPRTIEYRTKNTWGRADLVPDIDQTEIVQSGKKNDVSHSALVFAGAIDGDWSAWTDLTTLGPGIAQGGYECGSVDGTVYVDGDGFSHSHGIESATIVDHNWFPIPVYPADGEPEVLSGRSQLQLRANVPGLGLLDADILDLLTASGSLAVQMVDHLVWCKFEATGSIECGENITGWGFPGDYPVNHVVDSVRCLAIPFGAGDSGATLDVFIPELGTPDGHVFDLARVFGYHGEFFGNCSWGSESTSWVGGIGYFNITVPLS